MRCRAKRNCWLRLLGLCREWLWQVVAGKKKRLTFFECPSNDACAMLDLAKVADLVLLMVDGSFGFEMDTFEFLNMLQVGSRS